MIDHFKILAPCTMDTIYDGSLPHMAIMDIHTYLDDKLGLEIDNATWKMELQRLQILINDKSVDPLQGMAELHKLMRQRIEDIAAPFGARVTGLLGGMTDDYQKIGNAGAQNRVDPVSDRARVPVGGMSGAHGTDTATLAADATDAAATAFYHLDLRTVKKCIQCDAVVEGRHYHAMVTTGQAIEHCGCAWKTVWLCSHQCWINWLEPKLGEPKRKSRKH